MNAIIASLRTIRKPIMVCDQCDKTNVECLCPPHREWSFFLQAILNLTAQDLAGMRLVARENLMEWQRHLRQ